MMPSKKRKDSLELQKVEGRLDVLAYRLSESAVRMAEKKIGVGGLWDVIKNDVEDLIRENVGSEQVNKEFPFNILKRIMEAQRIKGGM